MKFVNQHSYFIFAGLFLLTASLLILRPGITIPRLFLIFILMLLFILLYFIFNPGSSTLSEANKIQAKIGSGKPVLLEFQSQF